MPTETQRLKRWTPKTRTGCRTCRLRRIKCDETRPICNKCARAGRKCEGYEVSPPVVQQSNQPILLPKDLMVPALSIPIHALVSLPIQMDAAEMHAFDCFRQKVIRALSGHFSREIWTEMVLKGSHSEPLILHGIIAIGAIFQIRHRLATPDSYSQVAMGTQDMNERLAVKHYMMAISCLRTLIESIPESERENITHLTLMACLMFVCFEMLQGNQSQAQAHLLRGLKILCEHSGSIEQIKGHTRRIIHLDMNRSDTVKELSTIFVRLDADSTMFGRESPYLLPAYGNKLMCQGPSLPRKFTSLVEAKKHLDTLTNVVLRFRGEMLKLAETEYFVDSLTDVDWARRYCMLDAKARLIPLDKYQNMDKRRDQLLKAFELWTSALSELRETRDYPTVMLLEVNYFFPWFILSNWTDRDECLCDRYEEKFEFILDISSKYTTGANRKVGSYAFSLESGILASVYLVGTKCRNSVLRRKAIELLRNIRIQEGFSNGRVLACYIEKLMELEEDRARNLEDILSIEGDLKAADVPEDARYRVVSFTSDPSGDRYGRLVCARMVGENGELDVEEHRFPLSR